MLFGHGYRQPLTQQASAGTEIQLHRDVSLSVAYLFVKGLRLQRFRDVNLGATAPRPIGIANSAETLVVPTFPALRPLSDFDAIQTLQSDASSVYHGMIVQLNKRFSSHVQFLASYTLGKVIDDAPSVYGDGPLSDSTKPSADRGPGVNDQRHRLSVSGVWDLDYADQMSGVTKALLSAWQLSFILTAQSGQPYSGMVQTDLNNDGNASNDRTPETMRNGFNVPSTLSLDPRLARTVRIRRRSSLQLACEAFNVFNRTNIIAVRTTQYAYPKDQTACGIAAAPCLVPQDRGLTAFGSPVTSAGPRIIQLSARFRF
jgi:hypothetical protein